MKCNSPLIIPNHSSFSHAAWCRTYSDVHFQTFKGKFFDLEKPLGGCHHVLARKCGGIGPEFEVKFSPGSNTVTALLEGKVCMGALHGCSPRYWIETYHGVPMVL